MLSPCLFFLLPAIMTNSLDSMSFSSFHETVEYYRYINALFLEFCQKSKICFAEPDLYWFFWNPGCKIQHRLAVLMREMIEKETWLEKNS